MKKLFPALCFLTALILPLAGTLAQRQRPRRVTQKSELKRIDLDVLDELIRDVKEGWESLDITTRQLMYMYHPDHITVDSEIVKSWVKQRLRGPDHSANLKELISQRRQMIGALLANATPKPEAGYLDRTVAKYSRYSHTLAQWEFQCKSKQLRSRGTVDYDVDGSVLHSLIDLPTPWASAVPGSVGEGFLKFFCQQNPLTQSNKTTSQTMSSGNDFATDVGSLIGRAIQTVAPTYPQTARTARITGRVIVRLTVDESGQVISADAIEGPLELRGAATDAARRWRFRPTVVDGKSRKVTGSILFNFTL
jgi:TonB family protein